MKKLAYMILIGCLFSCGKQSSPDGRSRMRDADIQLQIDSLKLEIKELRDSVQATNLELNRLKEVPK